VPNPISKSLRFNSADSATLTRTPASASNRKTWTWSGWVKRGKLGIDAYLFSSGIDSSNVTLIRFTSSNILRIYTYNGSTFQSQYFDTTAVFRDTSAWYHIVGVHDTTQATTANRLALYVNGVQQVGSTVGVVDQNTDGVVNSTNQHILGPTAAYSSQVFDGYMTEINFIDGQALTPSSFGMTDPQTGAWVPVKYTGTYGTNGFYLNFKDATSTSALGYDYSGNANNWTTNNFSVTAGAGNDSLTDVPTPWFAYNTTGDVGGVVRGNYATLNPLNINPSATNTFSNGNLNLTIDAYDVAYTSTIGVKTGKWYWEVKWTANGSADRLGVAPEGLAATGNLNVDGICWNRLSTNNGMTLFGSSVSGTWGDAFAVDDIIMFALDCDNNALYIGQNGTWRNSGSPTSGSSRTGAVNYSSSSLAGKTLFPGFGKGNLGTTSYEANFGQRPFAYTPPAGFLSLCTTNLPTPTIGATSTTQANDYFNVVLWTGNSTASQAITGVGFQPDLVWAKSRPATSGQDWVDAVRGATKNIQSNSTAAETTSNTVISFQSDGFTVGDGLGYDINKSGESVVGWCWNAGGSNATNTSGTITSTVRANTTAGFSIVTYTGTGANATVGHGLGVAPSFIICKARNTAGYDWRCYHTSLGATKYIDLQSTAAAATASTIWQDTSPTSTLFSVGTNGSVNANTVTYVAYCFAPVAGYSAISSYTGNGSTDGPFVYTGFRPAWIMLKCTNASGNSWVIEDDQRPEYNPANYLLANSNGAEGSGATYPFDILSNGFKLRNTTQAWNGSGDSYIYIAFADSPFKYANAR
jgi:hypothetical protein